MTLRHEAPAIPETDSMSQPDRTWDVDRLTAYAKHEVAEFTLLTKRSTVHLFRAGHALSLVRDKKKPTREWCKWQQVNDLSRTTVNDAIRLYEAAFSEEAVESLPIMEAFDRFEIRKRGKGSEATGPDDTQAQRENWEKAIEEARLQNGGTKTEPAKEKEHYEIMAISSDIAGLEAIQSKLPDPQITQCKGLVGVKSWVAIDQIDRLLNAIGPTLKTNPPKNVRLIITI